MLPSDEEEPLGLDVMVDCHSTNSRGTNNRKEMVFNTSFLHLWILRLEGVGDMEEKMNEPECPWMEVWDTKGKNLTLSFNHCDVSGEEWMEVFKVIMAFMGFGPVTIDELFNGEEE